MASELPQETTVREGNGRVQNGQMAMAVSNRVVQIVSDYTGRGPTKSRAYLHGDLVVCLLSDSLTKGERRLVDLGEAETVLRTRRTYQELMRADLSAAIEEITGRRAIAFFSDNHADPDMALEAVVLEPIPGAD